MKPIKTDMTTKVLGAPRDWDSTKHGECVGLPVVEAHGYLYSYWKPSLLQRLKLAVGIPIRLCVASSAHPPVSLEVTKQ